MPAESRATFEVRLCCPEPCAVDFQVFPRTEVPQTLWPLVPVLCASLAASCELCLFSLPSAPPGRVRYHHHSSHPVRVCGYGQTSSDSTAPLALIHTAPAPVPGQPHSSLAHSLQCSAPFLISWWLSHTCDHQWDPSYSFTSCPSLGQDSNWPLGLLIHRLTGPSSKNLHISSALQIPATSSNALGQSTLPNVPSLQLSTGPEQHCPWQNHYL